ncbi:mechanosensitive ion channel family protein [Anaerotignum lactatifermentans]|uniref:Mechanosensitive ion channel family protein n=1 Tax=Anaerotignum lactatifermentans TaxID=160404 RepID=A0ABS2GCD3_9FIRM|nr:mechanosensitive ion channel family protein [Anaerotignum lactatifermentans]MBM6828606.1 mechanosensitive ion channel family protein [Anaerotignum lactatifermentans]MBM6878522.1 mechanosensitive ion channel family protein [Anaerotignum lactatifermentans]MBM6950188.1 mechanosensitive ion channel family protein [Anaerotignum lactatifermentans]
MTETTEQALQQAGETLRTSWLPTTEKLLETATDIGIVLLKIILTFVICWFLIRVINHAMKKFFAAQTKKQRLAMTQRKAKTLNSITSSVVKYLIYFIGIFTVLTFLGVDSKSMLVVASAGSVAIGLGAQSVVTDMLEGFFILFEDHYAVGDIVTIQNITGTVESVTLRSTKLRDAQGCVHIIPNGSLGTVTNMCREFINAVVTVGVSYDASIDHVLEVLRDEMEHTKDMADILETPVIVGITGLDDSAVTIKIVAKCRVKTNIAVEAELRRRIKNRLDAEGIEIPYPQRTLHIINEKEA